MEKSLKNYVPVTKFSIKQRQKLTGDFHKFHIPISVKIFLKKVKKKKLTLIGMCRCSGYSVGRKSAGAIFSFQFNVHIDVEIFVHASMHLCLVRVWPLCGGK